VSVEGAVQRAVLGYHPVPLAALASALGVVIPRRRVNDRFIPKWGQASPHAKLESALRPCSSPPNLKIRWVLEGVTASMIPPPSARTPLLGRGEVVVELGRVEVKEDGRVSAGGITISVLSGEAALPLLDVPDIHARFGRGSGAGGMIAVEGAREWVAG
jgi:hypothetical protein